ncbi:MAG: phospho-N-acetylmuramoyl-pentapeptide-transferase [Bacteroidetes bacterium]|nr:phospho-N-acetylmuramoyl-pentapeptide-transferase [Bacteroidota bacterium]
MYYLFMVNMAKLPLLRAMGGVAAALIFALLLGSPFIKYFQKKELGQEIRPEGPSKHFSKQGTPTMGGLFLFLALCCATLLLVDFLQPQVIAVSLALILLGGVGFLDDYLKLRRKQSEGLSAKGKLLLQFLSACAVLIYIRTFSGSETTMLFVPWNSRSFIDLGFWYYPLGVLFIMFFANSVNLADGLDGLAGGLVIIILLLISGVVVLGIYSPGLAAYQQRVETALFLMILVGAVLGFLRFNLNPARVFMGDVGSQGLGGAIAVAAIVLHMELLVIVAGAVFLVETMSVILQVISFKVFGRRIFRMAPLHHHFEQGGAGEKSIVFVFWIAGVLSAGCAAMICFIAL